MADEVLKKIAENKILELRKDEQRLMGELSSKEAFHSAAWSEYGSELCGGEMMRDEKNIRLKIDEVVSKITLLRQFIDGKLDISREERLRKNSDGVAAQIITLEDSKRLIDEELLEITRIKNLLSVTF